MYFSSTADEQVPVCRVPYSNLLSKSAAFNNLPCSRVPLSRVPSSRVPFSRVPFNSVPFIVAPCGNKKEVKKLF